MSKFSILEKVSATRAILTVAKSIQEKRPDASIEQVVEAIEAGVIMKLGNLSKKPVSSLSANQVLNLGALRIARRVMPQVLDFLSDEETTRELSADERTALADLQALKTAKAKESAAKRKAKKDAETAKADPKQADMLANA